MENRIALVTGAGRGIGRAAALALSAKGARVAITSRTAEELETLIQEAAGADGRFLAITADLSNRQAVQANNKRYLILTYNVEFDRCFADKYTQFKFGF